MISRLCHPDDGNIHFILLNLSGRTLGTNRNYLGPLTQVNLFLHNIRSLKGINWLESGPTPQNFPRNFTSSTCSPTPPAPASTSVTQRVTQQRISFLDTIEPA